MQNTSGNVQDAMEEVDNKGFTIKSQLWDPIILAQNCCKLSRLRMGADLLLQPGLFTLIKVVFRYVRRT